MSFLGFTGLINAVTCTVLGIFVLLQNRRSIQNISYFVLNFSVALYSFGYLFWQLSKDIDIATTWFKILTVGIILINNAYLFFVFVFVNILQKRKKLLIACLIANIVFIALNFSNMLYVKLIPRYNLGFWPVPTKLFDIYLLFWFWQCLYGFYWLIKGQKTMEGRRKQQIRYFTLAAVFGFFGGATNWPMWYNIHIPPYPNILISLYIGTVAYAIVRHQLLDIEVVIKKTLVFAGISAFVVGIFVLATFLTQDILGEIIGIPKIWALIISAMIIVALIDPIKNFLINATDKYLFQKKYNPAELIKTFSKTVLTELDLDKIAESTVYKLSEALKLASCAILIPSREGNKFTIRKSYGISDEKISYEKNTPMMSYLSSVNGVILKENEKSLSEAIKNDMNLISANVCIAVMMRKELIGVLCLGKKKSDQEYTKDDIDILLLLADALGVAITNALAFEDVRQKEKLAAIGMLAAGIKHDIGTPINKMSSAIQLFLMERDEGDHKKIPMPEVLSSAYDLLSRSQMTFNQVSRISAKFADFARPKRQAELELIHISESIEEALSVLDCDIHARGISVKKNIQKDISPVRADREYMQEILFNIIKNAAQAIHEAHRSKDESNIIITAKEKPEKNVVVEISDTGVGIPEDSLDKVFEEYYTTKQGRGGTGLGLAIVKELVGRNKGKISVKSELGKGSTFILEFPGAEQ